MISLRVSPITLFALLVLVTLNGFAVFLLVGLNDRNGAAEVEPRLWRPASLAETRMSANSKRIEKTYQQTLARPIFFKDRRPYRPPPPKPPAPPKVAKAAPKPVAPAPPPITNPNLTLAGIAITSDAKQAFMTQSSKAEGSWVKEGEEIMGWRVHVILPGEVTLQKSGRSIKLRLYK